MDYEIELILLKGLWLLFIEVYFRGKGRGWEKKGLMAKCLSTSNHKLITTDIDQSLYAHLRCKG